jgi:acyl carrier protein
METEKSLSAVSSASALLQFVNEKLLVGSEEKMDLETRLFQDGWIDSLRLLQLIAFLEEQSKQTIPR